MSLSAEQRLLCVLFKVMLTDITYSFIASMLVVFFFFIWTELDRVVFGAVTFPSL